MIAPEIPENEAMRLATLYKLQILDTEPEERFGRLTRIACKLFGVPIAVISFLEAERQWMKSTQGFDIKEAARKTSFCGHVILSTATANRFLMVPMSGMTFCAPAGDIKRKRHFSFLRVG
ncbi:hypothetical protein [Legionella saoudiensis]|uniref:hypothetical protein n=1 Tax=Legionella saoudiensis TaxID=1750561 RepID=UPI0007317C91|nr:hypothetical protein [Legionella saoudiensis]